MTDTTKPVKKATARKAPAKKTPAEAAVAEKTSDSIDFEFRGQKFTVPNARAAGGRMMIATAARRSDMMLGELLGENPENFGRLLDTVRNGEAAEDVLGEFFAAVNGAIGVGNS